MSYDIMNYAFLALPVEKVCESLDYNTPAPLSGSGTIVVIDDKFSALTHGFIETFSDWRCSSLQQMVEDGFLESRSWYDTGARWLFTRLLLMAAGITNPVFYANERSAPPRYFRLVDQLVDEVFILPFGLAPTVLTVDKEDGETGEITRTTTPCEFGLALINNSTLASLAQALASEEKLTIDLSGTSGGVYDRAVAQVTCLKTALEKLLAMHAASTNDWHADGIQGCIQMLLDKFLESKECYCDIDVTSTLHRNCHDSGGMDDGVYVVYGNCSPYDEDGWTDPREEDPDTLAEARTHLLGDNSKLDWEKFTPKFGG